MDGLGSTESENALLEFTPTELREMESLFQEVGEKSPSRDFCQELATRFRKKQMVEMSTFLNLLCPILQLLDWTGKTGKPAMKWEKVKRLQVFQDCYLKLNRRRMVVGSMCLHSSISGLFIPEVRVRFSGFDMEEDEWVNVETGVRERSIPLESSECNWVHVGDLVICFRESDDDAIYCNAHIVKIHRRLHDVKSCRCIFVVRYKDNEVEEKVRLDRLCCRPK